MENKKQIWSCGGGTQSCAIGALIFTGILPKPDLAIIVNTGREVSTTGDYFNRILQPKLSSIGCPISVINASEYSPCGINIANRKNTLLLPAFSAEESNGKMPNFCSSYWKRDVMFKYLRKSGIKNICRWIGFSKDEQTRYLRLQRSCGDTVRFPLVHDIPMSRQECIDLVIKVFGERPPRSRCWCCPNQSDSEWLELSTEEFDAAIDLEKVMQKIYPDSYLHKDRVSLSSVIFKNGRNNTLACDSGECFN